MLVIRKLDDKTLDLFKALKYSKNLTDAQLLEFLIEFYYKVEAALV